MGAGRGKYQGAIKPAHGPLQVDWNNPISSGLLLCAPLFEGAGSALDVVPFTPRRTNGGADVWGFGALGKSAGTLSWPSGTSTGDLQVLTGPFTMLAFVRLTDASGTGSPSFMDKSTYTSESVNGGWGLGISATSVRYQSVVQNNNAAAQYQLIGNIVPTVGDHLVAMTGDQVTRSLYVDGRLDVSKADTTNPGACTFSFTSSSTASQNYLLAIFARCLSAGEMFSLWLDPWQLFRRPTLGSWMMRRAALARLLGQGGLVNGGLTA